jgi:EAL domain-containing protein (putative c-di-GMP-specific phosphodiesterase class I)
MKPLSGYLEAQFLVDHSQLGTDTMRRGDVAVEAAMKMGSQVQQERTLLLREIYLASQEKLQERQVFLIVINLADTKNYDEIIRIFGYKLADDLLNIRLADLEFVGNRQTAYRVGFWSVGLIFRARHKQDYEVEMERILSVLIQPVICRGIPISIKAGVGVCDLMKGQGAAEDLLQATYLAGQAGAALPCGWTECSYDSTVDHRRAFALISDAAHSLATPYEFSLRYQARVDLKTGRCDAAEAFLRWRHPTLGTVMPDEFIPLVEMTGLIRELTFWVLTSAIAQTANWHALGHKLKICVKISVKNLEEDDFAKRLKALLETHKLAPEFLELEFSERRAVPDIDGARSRLRELRDIGVHVSIDDFGTGTNSFGALESFTANAVKIDRRLIHSIVDNPRRQALVKSMIRMAHDLEMYVVAEGVETPAMLEMLVAWRCDYAEGFVINRPIPAEAFIEWYATRFNRT